jgi:uncharacterized membrane protein YhaH (DUF805 family)
MESPVQEVKPKIGYFSVHGRVGRVSFLFRSTMITIPALIIVLFTRKITAIAGLITAGLNFPISIRRFHDFNLSGWFSVLLLIPLVNYATWVFLIVYPGTNGLNRFGEQQE